MTNQEQQLQDLIRIDPEVWFSTFGVIKDKRGKDIKPMPNTLQKRMFAHYRKCQVEGLPCKMIILKPRQKGASTCAQALTYHHMRKHENLSGSLMGDIAGTSDKVFEIYRRYAENDIFPWDETGQNLEDGGSLADQIRLRTKSVYGKETAGSKNAGRSGTIQVGNMTEVAFWPMAGERDPALGYLQSLYDGDNVSLVVADSTPNGPAGWFYRTWVQDNEWAKIFAAWFEFDDSQIAFRSDEELKEFKDSLTDDEKSEMERFDVTWENMNWRRRVLQDKCNGDVSKFRQEYPSDPEECFLMSSRPRFHMDCLNQMSKDAENQYCQVGIMSVQEGDKGSFCKDPQGNWRVYNEPEHDSKYLISVDTCTGEDQQQQGLAADPDFHSVQVWRDAYEDWHGVWHVPRLVAVHHSRLDIGVLAQEVEGAARWYGGAFVVPEVNNSGLALLKYLLEMGLSVYRRRKVNDSNGMVEKSFGWSTDKITRKTVIDHMAAELMEGNFDIPDKDILQEMKVFVVNDKGKPEAAPGHHDDHVLAAAIALYNLDLASTYRLPKKTKMTNRMLHKNPGLFCPDGFMRKPLTEIKRRYKRLVP
ncbi:MAG: hypothetical protein CL532_01490 [Aestuariivita sp.]|nr:hypothetical protein [Aestuariivita sp.]|tara:strand:+ start:2519 stop:4279 length:1761 start_codon:yes stop_codon:yes gene_type:complete